MLCNRKNKINWSFLFPFHVWMVFACGIVWNLLVTSVVCVFDWTWIELTSQSFPNPFRFILCAKWWENTLQLSTYQYLYYYTQHNTAFCIGNIPDYEISRNSQHISNTTTTTTPSLNVHHILLHLFHKATILVCITLVEILYQCDIYHIFTSFVK